MIEILDLVKNHGKLRVLRGVTLRVQPGEVAVLIGPSGGGKSTLLRCINGLEPFQAGLVRVGEWQLGPGRPRARLLQRLRGQVGMVFQQFHLFAHLTVLQNVMAGPLWAQHRSRDEVEQEARALLARVGLADKADARPAELSGGQQQRVAIARSLAVRPQVILFDEPTSALDPRMAGEVLAVLTDLASAGQTMIVVTHAMNFARKVAHTVHVMAEGKVVESGPPQQIFGQPQQEVTRHFLEETANA
jgi:ABC-type polar amino acid transport system ATPase subunit